MQSEEPEQVRFQQALLRYVTAETSYDMVRTVLLLPILLGLLMFTAATDAIPAVDTDIEGVYICKGTNPDGSPYEGVVEVAKRNGAFQVQWFFEAGRAAVGMGIRSGDVLAVSYFSGTPGVVAYKIEEGSKLVGEWTVPGAEGKLFPETLTKAPPGFKRPDPQAVPRNRERRQRPDSGEPIRGTREL
jgi:hypothetical protein